MREMNTEILRIAIPNIISNITVPLMGIVSTAIAGHCNEDSVGTIGALAIGVSIFNFVYWNCSFVRMGTSGLTAQAYGAGDFKECTNLLARAIIASIILGVLMFALQYPLGELALWAMNGSQMTADYFYVRVWAVPAGIVLFGFNGWFTGMQNAVIPMFIAIAVNAIHVIFSLWFAFGLEMDIIGIAYGSIIAQYIGVVLAVGATIIFYGKRLHSLDWEEVFKVSALKDFFNINRDIMLRTVCIVVVYTFFTGVSARMENKTILAVNILLLELFTLFSYMSDGFAYAAEALTGRFIGARDESSLRKCLKRCIMWGTALSALFVSIYALCWRDLLYIFVDSSTSNASEIISVAGEYIGWIIVIPIVSALPFIMDGIMVGATHSRIMRNSMFMATFCFFVIFFAFYGFIGNNAIWLAFTLFMLLRGLIQFIMTDNLRVIYREASK